MKLLKISLVICCILGSVNCTRNEDPVARFNVEPRRGHFSQTFEFDASESHDLESRAYQLNYRWDFDGDNTWDTDWSSSPYAEHKYSERGTYKVLLEVGDGRRGRAISHADVFATLLNITDKLVDYRDGKTYDIVLIDSLWWMAEDLWHGKWISMYQRKMQVDNGIAERYGQNDFEDLDRGTGYYNYREAMDYRYMAKTQGLCPPGWYIPTNKEWKSLVDHIPDGKDPAIFLSKLGDEGVNLAYTGRRFFDWGQSRIDFGGLYWSSTGVFTPFPEELSIFFYPKDSTELRPVTFTQQDSVFFLYRDYYALPIRCVKQQQHE